MSRSGGLRKQVDLLIAGQQEANDFGKGIEVELLGAELPTDQEGLAWLRRLWIAALSHGRVFATPTTISALRSTRCLVNSRLLYTPKVGEVSGAEFTFSNNSSAQPLCQIPNRVRAYDTVQVEETV